MALSIFPSLYNKSMIKESSKNKKKEKKHVTNLALIILLRN
jgi:hypothetical protein